MNGDDQGASGSPIYCTPPSHRGAGLLSFIVEQGKGLGPLFVLMLLIVIIAPLLGLTWLGLFVDTPNAKDLGIKPASAAGTAQCSSGATGLHGSGIILACEGFQDTQLPNVFPEVPPAVATTPTPAPATPVPTPEQSSSSSSQSSQSSHSATPPPPPPPPANCIPNTMTADGSTVSGSGNTRSSERVYTWNSGAVSGSVNFTINGLNLGSTCSPHYSLVARHGPVALNDYGYSCGPFSSLTVPGTVSPNEDWTMWVDMEPSGCPSSPPH